MRKLYALLAVTVFCSGVVLAADDDDRHRRRQVRQVRPEGEADKCQNVIQVEEDGKTSSTTSAQNKVAKKPTTRTSASDHAVKTKATGEVDEKDGKKIMTATKIEKAE